jgi:hypothetical protein
MELGMVVHPAISATWEAEIGKNVVEYRLD